jgi:hypothetical protein
MNENAKPPNPPATARIGRKPIRIAVRNIAKITNAEAKKTAMAVTIATDKRSENV